MKLATDLKVGDKITFLSYIVTIEEIREQKRNDEFKDQTFEVYFRTPNTKGLIGMTIFKNDYL